MEMITEFGYLIKIIERYPDHPIFAALLQIKSLHDYSYSDLVKAIQITEYRDMVEEFDFFNRVLIRVNEENYCCMDSINGWLDYHLQNKSKWNLIKDRIAIIDKQKILNHFEALNYLKAVYEEADNYFKSPTGSKKTHSIYSKYLSYEKAIKDCNNTYERDVYQSITKQIQSIDCITRRFLLSKGVDVSGCINELIFERPMADWECFILKDLSNFITLQKELNQNKKEKLSYPKAHLIYYLIRSTYIGDERNFVALNFPLERAEIEKKFEEKEADFRRDISDRTFTTYIIDEVRKILDPKIRKKKFDNSKREFEANND